MTMTYEEMKGQLRNLVADILAEELTRLDETNRKRVVTKITNDFARKGLCTRSCILEADDGWLNMRFKGRYAQIVIHTIKGDINIRQKREKRVAEIDRIIDGLLKEKENLLRILD